MSGAAGGLTLKWYAALLVIAAALLSHGAASACTSFASYGEETYYGMNFDYDAGFPLRIFIDSSDGEKIFHLAFMLENRPIRTSGMSTRGLFSAIQELYPEEPGVPSAGPDELFVWQLYMRALDEFDRVEQATDLLATKRVVQAEWGRNLHLVIADAEGGAIVVEPGEETNTITPIDGESIVMTNFCVGDFVGSESEGIFGVGADRYVGARDYLEEHADSLDLEDAFEVLERTSWNRTRASMVFVPGSGEVYLAFERDFDRILRVSLESRTVKTCAGYDEPASWRVGALGLPATAFDDPKPGFLARVRRLLWKRPQ